MSDKLRIDLNENASKDDLIRVCVELESELNKLRLAINVHAEVLNIHRYILTKFVPEPLLKSACEEYEKTRKEEIAAATDAVPPSKLN